MEITGELTLVMLIPNDDVKRVFCSVLAVLLAALAATITSCELMITLAAATESKTSSASAKISRSFILSVARANASKSLTSPVAVITTLTTDLRDPPGGSKGG